MFSCTYTCVKGRRGNSIPERLALSDAKLTDFCPPFVLLAIFCPPQFHLRESRFIAMRCICRRIKSLKSDFRFL